jgi:hypothetical protein
VGVVHEQPADRHDQSRVRADDPAGGAAAGEQQPGGRHPDGARQLQQPHVAGPQQQPSDGGDPAAAGPAAGVHAPERDPVGEHAGVRKERGELVQGRGRAAGVRSHPGRAAAPGTHAQELRLHKALLWRRGQRVDQVPDAGVPGPVLQRALRGHPGGVR